MAYDHDVQMALDQKHLAYPMPGDFWHEMYCPIARILSVTPKWLIVQKVSGYAGKEISEEDPVPCVMTPAEFKKWISYETMPDKTWAHVIPERHPPS